MFNSIFSNEISVGLVFLMIAISVADGVIAAAITSLKMRSSKGFFVTMALMPSIVATSFYFLNVMIINDSASAIASIAAIMVGMGLIRFRSAQGKAEEMFALFVAIAIGAVNGLGYAVYATIIAVVFPLLFAALFSTKLFANKKFSAEKLLKITIPESLEYSSVFASTFSHYLKECEAVGVKTTGMGSMFRLSYRIVMKDASEEKELIDELRTKNGNLEISVLPYTEDARSL